MSVQDVVPGTSGAAVDDAPDEKNDVCVDEVAVGDW